MLSSNYRQVAQVALRRLRRTVKVKGTVVLLHAMKVHRGVKVAPRVRRVWMDLVTLTPFPFYPQSNSRRHSLNRKPAWSESRSGSASC
jgi:hypothetical protein